MQRKYLDKIRKILDSGVSFNSLSCPINDVIKQDIFPHNYPTKYIKYGFETLYFEESCLGNDGVKTSSKVTIGDFKLGIENLQKDVQNLACLRYKLVNPKLTLTDNKEHPLWVPYTVFEDLNDDKQINYMSDINNRINELIKKLFLTGTMTACTDENAKEILNEILKSSYINTSESLTSYIVQTKIKYLTNQWPVQYLHQDAIQDLYSKLYQLYLLIIFVLLEKLRH